MIGRLAAFNVEFWPWLARTAIYAYVAAVALFSAVALTLAVVERHELRALRKQRDQQVAEHDAQLAAEVDAIVAAAEAEYARVTAARRAHPSQQPPDPIS